MMATTTETGNAVRLDARAPGGPIETRWERAKFDLKLVNPANKRKFKVIVVGTGLAGASAAASLAELGYKVEVLLLPGHRRAARTRSPPRAASTPPRTTRTTATSVYRLFYDTVKGGDFRAREANVYRLAQVSVNIIDQCVAQGVPFAREYGGLLDNRSFGGAQVSRTFYARGQTGQQLLLGAYPALARQIAAGTVKMFTRTEMLDLVVIDGHARGIVARDLVTGEIRAPRRRRRACSPPAATATSSSCRPTPRAATSPRSGARTSAARCFANPCFTQIHPTCIPVAGDYQSKLTLMSRVAAQRRPHLGAEEGRRHAQRRTRSPRPSATTILERQATRASATSCRATSPRAPPRRSATRAAASGPGGRGVYLDFADAIERLGRGRRSRSATATCSRCTSGSPARTRTRRRCASTRRSTTRWAGCGSTTT